MKKIITASALTLALAGQAEALEWWEIMGYSKRPLTNEELASLPPQPSVCRPCSEEEGLEACWKEWDTCEAKREEWEALADERRRQTDEEEAARLAAWQEEVNKPEPRPSFWKRLGSALVTGLAAGASSYEPPRYMPEVAPPPQPSPFLSGPSYADRYAAETDRDMGSYWARRTDDRARAQALEQSWQATRARPRAELDGPSSFGVSQYYDQQQNDFTRNFLREQREQGPIEPGHIPYPCGFNRGNARAYEACQRDWMANNPNDYLWEGIK